MSLKIVAGRQLKHGWHLSVTAEITETIYDRDLNYRAQVQRVSNGLIESFPFHGQTGRVPDHRDLNKVAGHLAKQLTPVLPKRSLF